MYHSVLCEGGLYHGDKLDYVPSELNFFELHSFNTKIDRDNFVEYTNAHSKLLYRSICAAIPSRVYKALKVKLDKWEQERKESVERRIQLDIKKGYRFASGKVDYDFVNFQSEILKSDVAAWEHDLKYTPRSYHEKLAIIDRIADNKINLWHLEKLLSEKTD